MVVVEAAGEGEERVGVGRGGGGAEEETDPGEDLGVGREVVGVEVCD